MTARDRGWAWPRDRACPLWRGRRSCLRRLGTGRGTSPTGVRSGVNPGGPPSVSPSLPILCTVSVHHRPPTSSASSQDAHSGSHSPGTGRAGYLVAVGTGRIRGAGSPLRTARSGTDRLRQGPTAEGRATPSGRWRPHGAARGCEPVGRAVRRARGPSGCPVGRRRSPGPPVGGARVHAASTEGPVGTVTTPGHLAPGAEGRGA